MKSLIIATALFSMTCFAAGTTPVPPTTGPAPTPNVEKFNFTAATAVIKCVAGDNNTNNCSLEGDLTPVAVAVALSDCQTDQNGTTCSGTWQNTVQVDKINFGMTASVSKAADGSYSVTAVALRQGDSNPSIMISQLAHSTMTDGMLVLGTNSSGGKGISYIPAINLAPAGSSNGGAQIKALKGQFEQ